MFDRRGSVMVFTLASMILLLVMGGLAIDLASQFTLRSEIQRSMDAAARWIEGHGLPPPARGVRNTGEQAMLVGPEQACGAYIAFVGPA